MYIEILHYRKPINKLYYYKLYFYLYKRHTNEKKKKWIGAF